MPRAPSSPVADRLRVVAPPPTPVFRVARGLDPFAPAPWQLMHVDGTFGNRFDDPSGQWGRPPEERFRTIYCATDRAGAFAETIARFRPSLSLLADLQDIADDDPEEPQPPVGVVPQDWRSRRRLGTTTLDPTLRFVDLAAAATLAHLRVALAATTRRLGLHDFDISAVTGPHRRLTQEVARYVYEHTDQGGHPRFAGLRYLSRLNPAWACWAIFDDRIRHRAEVPATIHPDDPGLVEAAKVFGVQIELLDGLYLT